MEPPFLSLEGRRGKGGTAVLFRKKKSATIFFIHYCARKGKRGLPEIKREKKRSLRAGEESFYTTFQSQMTRMKGGKEGKLPRVKSSSHWGERKENTLR